MHKTKLLAIAALFLICLTPIFAAEQFDYKMSEPAQSEGTLSYYQAADSNQSVKNISGRRTRNIILCIGDGMGLNHVALARHQLMGPDKKLHMERLPVAGILRTHSANKLITDSAAAGTAMACGIKTNNGMIGMDPEENGYSSILKVLQEKGYRAGLVSTSAITHATPAAYAAHVKRRGMQIEIADYLLDNQVEVLFGGGRKFFLPKGVEKGTRGDSRDLIQEALQAGYHLAKTEEQLLSIDQVPALGLFADEGMTTFDPEPSVAQMSRKAIELLSEKTGKGLFAAKPRFFLMIEGSQIDWASHASDADRVIRQTLLFDMAVKEAVAFAQRDRHTLVIVTADHETGGLVLKEKEGRIVPEWTSGSHTAADVPVYAFGPGSEEFAGVLDNTEIPKRIAELLGVKNFPRQTTKAADLQSGSSN